jgi:hypothetical protein
MAIKDLKEKMEVGGGATGASMVPDPVGGRATLPASKQQGDAMAKSKDITPGQEVDECDPETNTKPTGDMSAQNKASVAMKEDIEAMFNGEELSEDFKEKATVIFEAALASKVEQIESALEEQYTEKLEQATVEVYEQLTAKVDEYLDYVVEQWMKENQVAIESTLRTEIMEDFVAGMKNLFAEHYIEVPEEKYDVLGDLSQKIQDLEDKLNETISENIELKSQLSEMTKDEMIQDVAEGLAATQVEKFKALAEGVTFDSAESYKRKLEIVKENYFPTDKKAVQLDNEEAESLSEGYEGKKVVTPVSNYVQAISRTIKR